MYLARYPHTVQQAGLLFEHVWLDCGTVEVQPWYIGGISKSIYDHAPEKHRNSRASLQLVISCHVAVMLGQQ
jgi:hypothetical protein